ncbi:MAG: hypothetical protein U1E05_04755 [Patescibacteria group bacterium]|nr:hypothetical protein [Patescibacteria group bacterium]
MRITVAAVLFTFVLPGMLSAQDSPEAAPKNPLAALAGVRWAGPAVTPDMLRDKSALILIYAGWCPKCNDWSGELFQQIMKAAIDKPVVVLAVNADTSPAGAQQYVASRGFFGPNVFHGYDPAIHTKLGFKSNLFHYVLVSPEGTVAAQGSAASFFVKPEGREFAVAQFLGNSTNLGTLKFIAPGMSAELAALLWPLELSGASEAAMKSVLAKLTPELRKEAEAAAVRYLDGRLAFIRERYKGEVPQRIEAYEAAAELVAAFRSMPQNQTARQVVQFMEADGEFKNELAAKKAYDTSMRNISENPRRRTALLKTLAQRFEGTHYGALAAALLDGAAPDNAAPDGAAPDVAAPDVAAP